jgi:16S rRNA (cytosine1402-N4)-methyltransferase
MSAAMIPAMPPPTTPAPTPSMNPGANSHIPVMLDEVLAALAPRDGGVYLDGTFGGGGYAQAILQQAGCTLWAIDRDPEAIARGASLAARFPDRLHLLHGAFGDMVALLAEAGVTELDGVVLDLGVSSFQLDDPARGFSFRFDGPLDMRMGKHGTSAADLVNTLPERDLADVLYEFGEERASRRIAHAIVAARLEAPIETTGRLAEIVRSVLPPDRSGNHPATRSFQALRIKVNDELRQIEDALEQAVGLLSPGGRLVVVAFHSLEDRIVKRFMTQAAGRTGSPSRHDPAGLKTRDAPDFRLLTARALRPAARESDQNPRSRSARLRALERLDKGRDT